MSTDQPQPTVIDTYIAQFPEDTQRLLMQLRQLIATTAPDAVETISYAMPTFKLNGRVLIHFAGYDDHIGVYPAPEGIAALEKYRTGAGTFRFPLDEPLPLNHLRRLITFQIHTVRARSAS